MTVIHDAAGVTLVQGDVSDARTTESIADGSVRTIVTSPPYFGLRDYGEDGQLGMEDSPAEYVDGLVKTFATLRRVLADDGTLWLNLGDSYYSGRGNPGPNAADPKQQARRGWVRPVDRPGQTWAKPKNLLGIPWRVAFALQADGWILRSDIVWAKPSGMPESVTDRPTRSHEFVFLFAKSPRYYYDAEAIAETSSAASIDRATRGRATRYEVPGQRPQTIAQESEGRPQLRRALEIAKTKGLTEEHFAAIRAVGMNDAGKAREMQSGAGKNAARVQHLADEAKAALGGYYREFLSGGTRNKRDVWTVATVPFSEAHFAVYPPELIRPCIRAGSEIGDVVLDPFSGSGTTGMVAREEGRRYIGVDLNREYLDLSLRTRFAQPVMDIWEDGAA